jgi:hypothetical protein
MKKREGKAENGWDARTGYLFGPDARGSVMGRSSESPNFHTPLTFRFSILAPNSPPKIDQLSIFILHFLGLLSNPHPFALPHHRSSTPTDDIAPKLSR